MRTGRNLRTLTLLPQSMDRGAVSAKGPGHRSSGRAVHLRRLGSMRPTACATRGPVPLLPLPPGSLPTPTPQPGRRRDLPSLPVSRRFHEARSPSLRGPRPVLVARIRDGTTSVPALDWYAYSSPQVEFLPSLAGSTRIVQPAGVATGGRPGWPPPRPWARRWGRRQLVHLDGRWYPGVPGDTPRHLPYHLRTRPSGWHPPTIPCRGRDECRRPARWVPCRSARRPG